MSYFVRVLFCLFSLVATAHAASTTTFLEVLSSGSPVSSVPPGTVVTLKATVSAGSTALATGQVSFCDADAAFCTDIHLLATAQLTSAGTATFKFIPGVGAHHYKAVFLGTNANAASTSAASLLTVPAPAGASQATTTAITASGVPGNYTLTAMVSGNAKASPTGIVSFLDTDNANYPLASARLSVGSTGLDWTRASTTPTGQNEASIVTADFNGDGIPDVMTANTDSLGTYVPGSLTVLLGKGDGTFATAPTITTGVFPGGLLAADFNSDGNIDIVYTDTVDGNIYLLLGKGDGTFTPATIIFQGTFADVNGYAVGDVNGDGILDLVGDDPWTKLVFVLLGNGDGTFSEVSAHPTTGDNPDALVLGDFNGDGKLDVAVENVFDANGQLNPVALTILLGKGDGTFTAAPSPMVGIGPGGLVTADFNGDGILDLAVANVQPPATIGVLLGKGDGTFAPQIITGNVIYLNALAVGDFNGDGKADLVAILSGYANGDPEYNVLPLLGNGDGTFTPAAGAADPLPPGAGVVADFNGDGRPDIAEGGQYSTISVYLNNWTGSATATVNAISPVGTGIHFVDATYSGDGVYQPSVSATTPLEAERVPTTPTLSATPTSSSPGQSVTLTASLAPDAAQNHDATGTVTFLSGGSAVGTGSISNGVATWTGTTLPSGSDTLTVQYAGDTNFAPSTSNGLPFTVGAQTPPTGLVVPVGTTSSVQTATITFTASGQLANIAVLTQGAPGLDFNGVSGGTCSVGTSYQVGSTCTVRFTFTPQRPGNRQGAITLTISSGMPIATFYVQGTGTGPQVNFSPGTLKTLPITIPTEARSIIVDAAGNLYLAIAAGAGSTKNFVLKETPNGTGYTESMVGAGFAYPNEIALDGAGNLYIADQDNYHVYKETLINGSYQQSTVGYYGTVAGVAVDGQGNLFVSTPLEGLVGNGGVIGNCGASTITLDGNGVIYCANGTLYTPNTGGGYTQGSFPGGFASAIDDNGNIFSSASFAAGGIFKDLKTGGGYTQIALGSISNSVYGVALDGSGNLYFSTSGSIQELDFADPPTLTFATTPVGQISSDSPQGVTLFNEGNELLLFTQPSQGENPTITQGFTIGATSTCPVAVPVGIFQLNPDESCTQQVNFAPIVPGVDNGKLTISTNNLNQGPYLTVVPLIGNPQTGPAAPIVTSVSPAIGPTAGNTTVTITGTGFTGATAVNFGSIPAASFTVNSATSITTVSPPGSATVNVTVTTPAGTSALTPSDQFTYTSGTQTILFTQPPSAYAGTSALLSATGGASGNPVVFSIISGPASLSGANGSTITYTGPGTVTIEADQAAGNGLPSAAPVQVTTTATVLTVPIASASTPVPTVVTFTQAGTLGAISTYTSGAPNLDFTSSGGSTCAVGRAYAIGDTCTVNFAFQPTHPGLRNGSITFTSASGAVLANSFVYGLGTGPQVIFHPGSQSLIGSNFGQPSGIAISGTGDIFVSTYVGGLQEIAANGTTRTIGTLGSCDDVAVDGSGNVFAICNRTTLIEVLAVAGEIPQNPTILTLVTTFQALNGMKVDGNGNVYIAGSDTSGGDNAIYEVLAVNGSIPASPSILTLTTALHGFTGVAIDVSGDLFVSDELSNGVYEFAAVNGVIPPNAPPIPLGSGFSQPTNIALDAAGDVFVTDLSSGGINEILAVGGTIPATQPVILTLGKGLNLPEGLAIEPNGNILVADGDLTQAALIDVSDPPVLNFAQTPTGQTSSDSPQAVTFLNDGNAPLTLAALPAGINPSITTGFTLGASSTCPQISPAGNPQNLAEGASCTDLVSFTPATVGIYAGKLIETDNALNQNGATQTVLLNGVAIPPLTISLSATPSVVYIGSPVTLTATLVATGPALTGSVTFFDGTQSLGTVTPRGSTATLVVSTFAIGVHTITAVYSGDKYYGNLTSSSVQVTVLDFALTTTVTNVVIDHGGTATVQMSLSPIGSSGLLAATSLEVHGYPEGSVVTLTPSSIPNGSGTVPITLVIQTPNYPTGLVGSLIKPQRPAAHKILGTSLSICFILCLVGRRHVRFGRLGFTLMLLVGTVASLSLSGCGWGWKTQVWDITVSAQSGPLTHSVSFTLTSDCKNGQQACQITTP